MHYSEGVPFSTEAESQIKRLLCKQGRSQTNAQLRFLNSELLPDAMYST